MNTTHGPMRAHPLGRGSQGRAVPPPPDRPCSQSYDPALTLGLDRPYYIFPAHRDCFEPAIERFPFRAYLIACRLLILNSPLPMPLT